SRATSGSGSCSSPSGCSCWNGISTIAGFTFDGSRMTSPAETSAQTTRGGITGALESREPQRRPFLNYRSFIKGHYDGLPGALTAVTGFITGHEALAGRLIRPGAFDVRGCKRILDAGCGNGRYSKFLLREANPDAILTSFDLSPKMLVRAKARLRNPRVTHAVADL